MYDIPQAGRASKGKSIYNLLELEENEKISAFVPVKGFDDKFFVVMATKQGIIKKTPLSAFANPRKGGIIAIGIEPKDELIDSALTNGSYDLILSTRQGQAIRFPEEKVRDMGRQAYGVRGVTLEKNDIVVAMVVVKRDASLLTVTEKGFGKRSNISDYRVTNRGGKGIINMKLTDKTGVVVAVKEVLDEDEVMLITQKGIIIRQPVKPIRVIGRNTQGIKLISLDSGDKVMAVARYVKQEGEEAEEKAES